MTIVDKCVLPWQHIACWVFLHIQKGHNQLETISMPVFGGHPLLPILSPPIANSN